MSKVMPSFTAFVGPITVIGLTPEGYPLNECVFVLDNGTAVIGRTSGKSTVSYTIESYESRTTYNKKLSVSYVEVYLDDNKEVTALRLLETKEFTKDELPTVSPILYSVAYRELPPTVSELRPISDIF